MYRFAPLVILAVLLSGCGRSLSPDEAQAVLQRVQQARRSVTLQGQLTTSVRVRGQLLTSAGRVRRGPGVTQVQYLTGRFAGWWLIEQDGMVWRIHPNGQPTAAVAGADPGLGIRLSPEVRVRYDGPAWTAHRRALHYTVRPPASDQPRLELTVDAATYFPLRLERYGTDGQLGSATAYHAVDFNAQPPQRLPVPAVASPAGSHRQLGRDLTPATEQQLAKVLGGPLLKPTYIPRGFKLRGVFLHRIRQREVAEIRYFDGLRMLAVMQLQRPARRAMRETEAGRPRLSEGRWGFWRRLQPGPAGAAGGRMWPRAEGIVRPSLWRGNVLRERRGDRIVIVAGELAPEELRKVMASIPYPSTHRAAVKF